MATRPIDKKISVDNTRRPLRCFITGVCNEQIDPYLQERGFSRGLVIFAIPDYGILFRCRAEGKAIDLEFGAFFSLLRFIKTRLSEEKIKRVQVFSSLPEFVFAFTGQGKHLTPDSSRFKMLEEYAGQFQISVSLVERRHNHALGTLADMASTPISRKAAVKPENDSRSPEFKPYQRGIKL